MPKIKLPSKSPNIDMTPMVDLFSVILIFLMLTTTFRAQEPSPVDTPYSISEKPVPDFNMMTIVISNDNKVFFNIDNGEDTLLAFRQKILEAMGERYDIEFTPEELSQFEKFPSSMGVPIQNMKEFFAADANEKPLYQTGIPIDSLDNQLSLWILFARQTNPNVNACIKGDASTGFPAVRKVLDILQDRNVNNFSLITSLETAEVELDEENTE
jgi:biopolymer transport protein ExbD